MALLAEWTHAKDVATQHHNYLASAFAQLGDTFRLRPTGLLSLRPTGECSKPHVRIRAHCVGNRRSTTLINRAQRF